MRVEFIIVGGANAARLTLQVERGNRIEWSQFTLSTSLDPVDLFGEIILGGDYVELLPHTIELEIFGNKCRCLGLKRLIEVKRATGRAKDLEVVAELEALLEERDT